MLERRGGVHVDTAARRVTGESEGIVIPVRWHGILLGLLPSIVVLRHGGGMSGDVGKRRVGQGGVGRGCGEVGCVDGVVVG